MTDTLPLTSSSFQLQTVRARRVQLYGWRDAELAELFATLDDGVAPSGHLEGRLMAITGLGWLPRWLSRLLYSLLGLPINPWRGKSFADSAGANRWFHVRGPGYGRYRIERQAGPDGQPSIWLNYNLPENLAPLRPIRGEARQIQPGLWLCRMLWAGKRGHATVLWFTLAGGDDGR